MEHCFFVLKRGQEITEEILGFCEEKRIRSAYFSAIGAVSEAELAFYDIEKKKYLFRKFGEDLEIDSLTGNVAVLEEKLALHAHGVFSGRDMKATGGHLKSAVVSGTCEVFLVPLNRSLTRSYDEDTGLNLIKP